MRIGYEIRFSKKRKTLGIVVERDGHVIVLAPEGLPPSRISELVSSKQEWIKEKITETAKYPEDKVNKEFVSGETILYLGRERQLVVLDDKWFDGVKYEDGTFYIARHTQPRANLVFRGWYTREALKLVNPMLVQYAMALGVSYNECRISEMKYRWASCTPKKNILLNWRILKAPLTVIHYLIVHEMAHLLEPSHNENFWNIVASQLPRFEESKSWLRTHGNLLEIDF